MSQADGTPDTRGQEAQGRPAKRVKVFRACATCVSRKSRCEDVTPEGCSHCRRRQMTCSLVAVAAAMAGQFETSSRPATVAPTATATATATPVRSPTWNDPMYRYREGHSSNPPSSHPTPAPFRHATPQNLPTPPSHRVVSHSHNGQGSPHYANEVDDLRHRLADAEHRFARTEAALEDLEARFREQQHSQDRDSRPYNANSDEYPETHVNGPLRLATMHLTKLDETLFSVSSTRFYPDPVSVVSAGQAELAWHGFKARIVSVLPLPPFLDVSTPVPAHPFVLLAALHHVPGSLNEHQREAVGQMVQQSLVLAMGGAASIDVVLALLILSLAPPMPDNGKPDAPTNPTAYRLASLAYSMGQGLGLDGRAEAVLSTGEDLDNENWAKGLWFLQLWCAVSNRFFLLSMMNAMTKAPPQPLALRLPVLSRESLELCNVHLRAEAQVCEIYRAFVSRLSKMEQATSWPLVELEDLKHEWEDARNQIRLFVNGTDQPPSVQNDATCSEFSLGVRIASLTTSIPSPLREARETALLCLNRFPTTLKSMLDVSLPRHRGVDPSNLPEYIIIQLATALVCFRRSVQFVAAAYPQSQLVDPGRLDAAETTLRALGRAPRFILDESNRLLQKLYASPMWPNQPYPQPEKDGHLAMDEFAFNAAAAQIWDTFDFGLLYPDMMPIS